jgi:hypothetical protein
LLKRFRASLAGVLLALSAFVAPVGAAPVYSEDAVKAAYLYRFASYVEWPAAEAGGGVFVIGIAGEDGVALELERLLPGLTIRGRRAEARRVATVADLAGVHILFVADTGSKRLRAVHEAAAELPILVVSDEAKGLERGSVINFILVNRNVRFEISLLAADKRGLRIDSALLSVAARVQRRPQTGNVCTDPYRMRYRPSTCVIRVAAL